MTQLYPPGPKNSFWGLRHVARLRRDLLGFSAELVRDHGDVVYYRIGPVANYQLTHPDHIQEVLARQSHRFHRPTRMKRVWRKFEGGGLVLDEGAFWLRQRRLVQPAFGPEALRRYADVMAGLARDMVARWEGRPEIEASAEMARLTLEVVARTLFGAELSAQAARVAGAVAVIQEKAVRELSQAFPLPDWLPLPHKIRERRAIRYLHDLVGDVIRERRAAGLDRGDLLSLLLSAVGGEGMTDREARDEAVTLLLAGYETTANALTWTVYLLARHPDVQAELAAVLDRELGGQLLTGEDLPALGGIERAFNEALRLYPPVYFFSREAVEDAVVGDYRIARGSLVHLVPWLVHRDARWFDRPGEFLPERFAPEREGRRHPFAYFPFGGGPHACIGKAFATAEAVLALAAVLQRYRLTLAPGQGEAECEARLTLYPKGGVRIALTRREPDIVPGA